MTGRVEWNRTKGVWCVYGPPDLRRQVIATCAGVEEIKFKGTEVDQDACFVQVEVCRETYNQLRQLGCLFTAHAANAWLRVEREEYGLSRCVGAHPIPGYDWPTPEQAYGVRWLSQVRRGILLDKVGFGKTAQAGLALEHVEDAGLILIVCTKSQREWWIKELRDKVSDDFEFHLPTTRTTPCLIQAARNVVIVHWQLLSRKSQLKTWLLEQSFDVVIADEFHAAKDRGSLQSQAIFKIARNQPDGFFWGLTGTATDFKPNSDKSPLGQPEQYWALLRCLDPDRFKAYWRWYEMFMDYGWDHTHRYRKVNRFNGFGGARNVKVFNSILSRYTLRRTKIEGLPPVRRGVLYTEWTKEQREFYMEIKNWAYSEKVEQGALYTANALTKLLRLRQIITWPRLVGGLSDDFPKLDALLEHLDGLDPEQNVVVYSCFRGAVEETAKRIKSMYKDRWAVRTFVGNDLASGPEITEWLAPRGRILCTTVSKGGTSHNYQHAQVEYFLDRPWSSIQNEQVEGRLERRSQTSREIFMVDTVISGSVDEYVRKLLASKGVLNEADFIPLVREFIRSES